MSCGKIAHDVSIDGPNNLRSRPINCISMKSSLGVCHRDVFGDTVVQDTFAKIIGLSLSSVDTNEFPIDLVHIIRDQDHATDYAITWSNLGDKFDTSKKEEEIRIDSWSITLFPKIEHSTHGRVEGGILIESAGPIARKRLLLCEIHEVRAGRKTQSIRAGDYENRQFCPYSTLEDCIPFRGLQTVLI